MNILHENQNFYETLKLLNQNTPNCYLFIIFIYFLYAFPEAVLRSLSFLKLVFK